MIKYSVPFVLGVAIGALVVGAWFVLYPEHAEAPTDTAADMPAVPVAGTRPAEESTHFSGDPESFTQAGNAVSVRDQQAGNTIVVDSASLAQDGWIVVHEEILDGVIGNALGATRKDAGTYTAVSIELLRPTVAGKHYWVTVYADNGDKIFSLKDDTPLFGTTGELLLAGFTATP